jgi:hypothetical protein
MIFVAFSFYYALYFILFDHLPLLFSREDQERDFYMDLYESGTELLTSLDRLEADMTLAKDGTITPTLGKNLKETILKIGELSDLIEKKSFLLEGKLKFRRFLMGMLGEVMTIYAYVFESLDEKIQKIEQGIDMSELDPKEKERLLLVIKPILDKRRGEMSAMKERILLLKISIDR